MTEEEYQLQLARREGAVNALRVHSGYGVKESIDAAAELYPITLTRPRVVRIGGHSYRVVDGVLFVKTHESFDDWVHCLTVSVHRLQDFNDLFANPTEEVNE